MTTPIHITIPGAPVGKERPRFTRDGRVFTPQKTRSWESCAGTYAQIAMVGKRMIQGPVAVDVLAVLAIPKSWSKMKQLRARQGFLLPTGRGDWDNYGKAACDALNGIVYYDDGQIVDGRARKIYGADPRVEITVTPLSEEERDADIERAARRVGA